MLKCDAKNLELMNTKEYTTIIIGGGAAGFFAALAQQQHTPDARVVILEKNQALLSKVRVSGGGRCNVTHACFEPKDLVKSYPRGSRELIGPFHQFGPTQTINWFAQRGVPLKEEADGRMFPITDNSETIIQCFLDEAKNMGIDIVRRSKVESLESVSGSFEINADSQKYRCKKLILATGSSLQGYAWAKSLGHTIQAPVPSLFTFNVPNSPLSDLSGISVEDVSVSLVDAPQRQSGPILITHFGFSGPAVLKLSAWAARILNQADYHFSISINWLKNLSQEEVKAVLTGQKKKFASKSIVLQNPWKFPKKLWKHFLNQLKIGDKTRFNDLSTQQITDLANKLVSDVYEVFGKTTNKEEFVTCGGINLKEVDFRTMQSKKCKNLYFAGEILDIDGITGGFNFQNAWTTGFIAGNAGA